MSHRHDRHHRRLSIKERAMELIESGKTDDEVLQVLKEEHPHSEDKYLILSRELAKGQIRQRREK